MNRRFSSLGPVVACFFVAACPAHIETESNEAGSTSTGTEGCVPGETDVCYSGPAETLGFGVCREGQRTCGTSGTWDGACDGEVTPFAEDCGVPGDESCDGVEHACTGTPGWVLGFGDEQSQYATDIAVDPAGDLVFVASTNGTFEIGGHLVDTLDPYWSDVVVVKLDASGQALWARTFGDDDPQSAGHVAVDGQANILFTLNCGGTMDFGVGRLIECPSWDELVLVKLSPSGDVLWANHYPDIATSDVVADQDGNVLVAVSHDMGQSSTLAKLDPSGAAVWQVNVRGLTSVIDVVEGDAMVIAGTIYGDPETTFVAKLSPDGEELWRHEYYGTFFYGVSLVADAQGNSYLGSGFEDTVALQTTTVSNDPSLGTSSFIVKLDPNGNEVWVHAYQARNEGRLWLAGASTDALGNPVFTAGFQGEIDLGGQTIYAVDDAVVFKLRSDTGAALWALPFGREGDRDWANAIASDGAFTHFVTGAFGPSITLGDVTLTNANPADPESPDGLVFALSE